MILVFQYRALNYNDEDVKEFIENFKKDLFIMLHYQEKKSKNTKVYYKDRYEEALNLRPQFYNDTHFLIANWFNY